MRTGRLWARNPPKAKVSVAVGKPPGGGLNGHALCQFDAAVTLDGETLTEEKLRLLAESRDGLGACRADDMGLGKTLQVLTTYGQFTRLKELAKLPFYAVIADEAQAIKNPGSGQSKAVRSVFSPRRLALTGTPVENRLTDLWSIFDFVNPGLLGGITAFRKATDKAEDYSVVRKLTHPFILRRLKTDKSIISDLPDKTELDVTTALSRKQTILLPIT